MVHVQDQVARLGGSTSHGDTSRGRRVAELTITDLVLRRELESVYLAGSEGKTRAANGLSYSHGIGKRGAVVTGDLVKGGPFLSLIDM